MSDLSNPPQLFSQRPEQRSNLTTIAWVVAGAIVALVVVGLVAFSRHNRIDPQSNAIMPLDSYAAHLPITGLVMSESTSLSGGKSTYVDGHIANTGNLTVHGARLQVIFRNSEGLSPQVFTVPLTVISMREPYVDTRMLTGNPLKPADQQDFRLTFEQVAENWNQEMLEVRVISVEGK